MTFLAIAWAAVIAAIGIEALLRRRERQRWQYEAAHRAASAYLLNRGQLDHVCRGVNPGDVDPAEQIIPLAESASYQRICEFLAKSEAARFDPDSADWGKGA